MPHHFGNRSKAVPHSRISYRGICPPLRCTYQAIECDVGAGIQRLVLEYNGVLQSNEGR